MKESSAVRMRNYIFLCKQLHNNYDAINQVINHDIPKAYNAKPTVSCLIFQMRYSHFSNPYKISKTVGTTLINVSYPKDTGNMW